MLSYPPPGPSSADPSHPILIGSIGPSSGFIMPPGGGRVTVWALMREFEHRPRHASTTMMLYVSIVLLADVIGGVSYIVERTNGRSRRWSLYFGGVALFVGLAVAGVKELVSYH